MHKIYKARFYNGISSKAFTVDVSFGKDHLHIFFVDDANVSQNIDWQKKEIREIQYSSGIISLKHGDTFPYQQLDVTDPEFIREYKDHFTVSAYNRIAHSRNRRVVFSVFAGFVALLLLAWFFLLPFLADIFARSFPKEYEISMGEKLYESILEGEEIDSAKTVNINLFFRQMKIEGDYPVRITVVEKNIENAFALPGGGIVVYDKILESMNNYDELAALLAHEYSHVQLKHATRNIFRSLSGYIFISLFFGDVSGVSAVIIQNAEGLRSMKYGRGLEHEADENGLKILEENKIEAGGMADLFMSLKKGSNKGISEYLSSGSSSDSTQKKSDIFELFSTHPDIDSRISFVRTFEKEHQYKAEQQDSMKYYFERLK